MWLTGFDAPSLHSMYVDKPMRGHGLMQAIARVNRVFRDKPGGLVVDYLGLAHELKRALATYTENGGTGQTALNQAEAVAVMLGEVRDLLRPVPRLRPLAMDGGDPAGAPCVASCGAGAHPGPGEREGAMCARSTRSVASLRARRTARRSDAHPRRRGVLSGRPVRVEQASRGRRHGRRKSWSMPYDRSSHGRWASEGVIDIFAAAGLEKPDISILSDEFLAEVRGMQRRNLAVELLQKLLKGELAVRRRKKRPSRRGRSPRCWSRPCAVTRTAQWKPPK